MRSSVMLTFVIFIVWIFAPKILDFKLCLKLRRIFVGKFGQFFNTLRLKSISLYISKSWLEGHFCWWVCSLFCGESGDPCYKIRLRGLRTDFMEEQRGQKDDWFIILDPVKSLWDLFPTLCKLLQIKCGSRSECMKVLSYKTSLLQTMELAFL